MLNIGYEEQFVNDKKILVSIHTTSINLLELNHTLGRVPHPTKLCRNLYAIEFRYRTRK